MDSSPHVHWQVLLPEVLLGMISTVPVSSAGVPLPAATAAAAAAAISAAADAVEAAVAGVDAVGV